MTVDSTLFKQLLGSFPSGVTVITANHSSNDKTNTPFGVTVSAFSSLSLHPPLVLFNLDNHSTSHSILTKTDYVVVNILSERQHELAILFASGNYAQHWHEIKHQLNEHHIPVLSNTTAHISCRVLQKIEGGDHTIFVGSVIGGQHDADKKPLIYYRGLYHHIEHSDLTSSMPKY